MKSLFIRTLFVAAFCVLAFPAFSDPIAQTVSIQTRDPRAQDLLNQALSGSEYWEDAAKTVYPNKQYDEIRLKRLTDGYMAMITGEGDMDFIHDVVAETVFEHQDRLPEKIEGAKSITVLGRGTDPKNGLPYRDVYFFLDLSFFYATYAQRMYKLKDGDRTVLFFEKLTPEFVDAETWTTYQAKIQETDSRVDKRWAPLDAVVPIVEIFGMFIVQPGETRSSRVTFVSKLRFDDASWLAKWGSEIPFVIRGGLKSGFTGCVSIAKDLQRGQ